jgi:hypothetical protein
MNSDKSNTKVLPRDPSKRRLIKREDCPELYDFLPIYSKKQLELMYYEKKAEEAQNRKKHKEMTIEVNKLFNIIF